MPLILFNCKRNKQGKYSLHCILVTMLMKYTILVISRFKKAEKIFMVDRNSLLWQTQMALLLKNRAELVRVVVQCVCSFVFLMVFGNGTEDTSDKLFGKFYITCNLPLPRSTLTLKRLNVFSFVLCSLFTFLFVLSLVPLFLGVQYNISNNGC